MSLIKEKSNEDNYRRDSFEDRVCDDLCQHILQYLKLEDRLRLECVSKQFQRTALLSQRSLDFHLISRFNEDMELIKQFVQKFQKLGQISVDFSDYFMEKPNDLIELIIKYCNYLTHIQIISHTDIEEEVQKKFFEKFGQQLISWDICSYDNWVIKAPNIEELVIHSFDTQLSQIKFNRLKRFCVSELLSEDLNQFEVFIEKSVKTLKHLEIESYLIQTNDNFRRLLKIVSKLINLVHLSINISEYQCFSNLLTNYWKEIAINCKQIKSLRLSSYDLNDELLSILKQFKRLKRLNLYIWEQPVGDCYPFQDLKSLEGLTHMMIAFITSDTIEETILTDIDINFPKLRSLSIDSPFVVSEITAQILSRLSSLETLELCRSVGEDIPHFENFERQLIEKCRKLKKLSIN